ncbi:MAG: DUF362 domain-containing protein [bacterium]|nr:DUF362 domain-containing protein [bacterium]
MSQEITRRSFIKKSAAIGTSTILGSKALDKVLQGNSGNAFAQGRVDVSVVEGQDYFRSTIKAIEELGGISRFVPEGSKVAILPNAQRNNPGAYTNSEIVRGVIKLCKDAGAEKINCLTLQGLANWESMGYTDMFESEDVELKIVSNRDESQFKSVEISNGKALKEAQIMKELDNYDLFINIPITKDHAGTKFTGTMKNMMGLNFSRNNRTFHKQNWQSDVNAIKHLEQCVADINTVVKPALNIVDATVFITTNGPFGPGELIRPHKIVAGVDRVAMDSYCCTLWGLKPEDIFSIGFASEHGLGEMDLEKVNIRETAI